MLIPEVMGALSENAVKTAAHTKVSPSPLPETLAVKMEGSLKVGTYNGGTAKQDEYRSNLVFYIQSTNRFTSGRATKKTDRSLTRVTSLALPGPAVCQAADDCGGQQLPAAKGRRSPALGSVLPGQPAQHV